MTYEESKVNNDEAVDSDSSTDSQEPSEDSHDESSNNIIQAMLIH